MKFDEVIQLQALKLKQLVSSGGSFPDQMLDKMIESNPEEAKARQVCAMVAQSLFDDLEKTCQTLDISKRRFVEAALIEAIDRSKQIVAQINPFEHVEQGEHA